MMGDVLTVTDLETAKKHDTFHTEVITGKSNGVDVDYATNAVTGQVQKTLPATVNGIDWTPVGNLTTNDCTFTKSTDYAVDDSGTQWAYNGTFPFTSTAPVVPSAPDYYVVHVGSLQALSGLTESSELDAVHIRRFTNIASMLSFTGFVVGRHYLVDLVGVFEVISISNPMTLANFKLVSASIIADVSLNNTVAGYESFTVNTTGYNNTGYGRRVLENNTSGYDNAVFGTQSMRANTTGNRNTAIGVDVLADNTTGDHNLGLGQNALRQNTIGTYNTALGIDALQYGLNNNFNTAIGQYAALNLEGSSSNTVIGYNTFQAATSGNSNVTLGSNTLANQVSVNANTAIGTDAGRDNISGAQLTLVGYRAGRSNTTGTHLTAIGDQAAFKNQDGAHNFALGFTALYNNVSGDYSVAIGDSALYAATNGYNIGIGNFAGYSVTTGTYNTFIGYGAGYNASQKIDVVNSTAIGRGAFTTEDNTVQLGNTSVAKMGVGANKIAWLSAVPATGTWARGDVVWNLAVVAGGIPGWICVSSGTPGTWKAMANVAA